MAEEKEKENTQMQSARNQQLMMLDMQIQQMEMQLHEMEHAKEDISGASGKIYRTAGMYLIEVSKDEAMKDILDKSKMIETRIEMLKKQGERFRGPGPKAEPASESKTAESKEHHHKHE